MVLFFFVFGHSQAAHLLAYTAHRLFGTEEHDVAYQPCRYDEPEKAEPRADAYHSHKVYFRRCGYPFNVPMRAFVYYPRADKPYACQHADHKAGRVAAEIVITVCKFRRFGEAVRGADRRAYRP